ncbi:MAG: hypothetical protein WC100_06935 [Sterolibacterium sp.]
MAGLTAKFDLIDVRRIVDELKGTPAEQSAALAKFAQEEIAEADGINRRAYGKPIPHTTFVDGRETPNLATVKPNGVIVAEWNFAEEIIAWCYKELRNQAPVLSGEYRDSITIFADDVAVESPAAAASAEQVVIVATVPYARKLEGIAGPKYMSSQAPDGIFQVVAAIAKKRFGNQAKIYYTFRGVRGRNSLESWAFSNAQKRARGTGGFRRQFEKNIRNPAILIIFK